MNGRLFSRREFIAAASTATAVTMTGCAALSSGEGIIDTHTHFYDPTRPQGVPWPPKTDALLHRPVYPEEFKRLAQPFGVTGTVVVEASPWLEDNQWVLELAARDPFLLGVVGNVKPGRAEFSAELRRFAVKPSFRGIRVGVWEKPALTDDAAILRDLKLLADLNLTLDVLTGPERLESVARLAAAIPDLRIVIDHCANVRIDGGSPPTVWIEGMRACARYRNVFMKVSGLVEGTGRTDGSASVDAAYYRPVLDAIWEAFGPERVLYGSNWPVSARFGGYATVMQIVSEFFRAKGETAAAKYFSQNARRAYRLR